MIFWDICNNFNEIWKYMKFLLVTVSMLRLLYPNVAHIYFITVGMCSFLPGPQSNYTCAQSLSKSLMKVDPLDFRFLLFISCRQLSKGLLFPPSPEEQVTLQTSQQMFIHYRIVLPINTILKTLVPILSFTLCSFYSLDVNITVFVWDSFLVILILEFGHLYWSCLPVHIDIIAQKLGCQIYIGLSPNWLEWWLQPLLDLLDSHLHLNTKCRGVSRLQLHFRVNFKTNLFI